MATRFAQAGDLNAAKALDDAVLDELRADFGPLSAMTLAKAQTFLNDADKRAVVYLTQNTLRGVLLAVNTQLPLASGHWEIIRVVTQKSLTDAQRITGFRDMVAFVAAQFPLITIHGVVKAGGKLDNFLTPKGYERTAIDADVLYTPAPGEPPPGIPASGDDPIVGTTTIAAKMVRHSALASVVAATI